MGRRQRRIPEPVVERLCRYHRYLSRAVRRGVERVPSKVLAEKAGATPEQVRKDLSHFGAFGQRGVGYEARHLLTQIRRLLGILEEPRGVAIVGVGHLGTALAGYPGFEWCGFRVVGLYDNNPARIGHMVQGLRVRNVAHLPEDARELGIDIAMLAVPEGAAQAAAEAVVAAGIRAVLSFAPTTLSLPEDVIVRYVDMTSELEFLSFWLEERGLGQKGAEAEKESGTRGLQE